MALSRAIAPALVTAAVLAGIIPLLWMATDKHNGFSIDSYTWSVLRFTLLQAVLSMVLSVIPAIFVSRALARRYFPGRDALLAVFAIPLSLPVIVAVLGVAQVYGTAGWLGGYFNLYGLNGILIAHVFFNLPLAARILLEAQQSIPPETHRLAAQLGLSGTHLFWTVEWPALKPALASACTLIFLLCASSFVIVLTLGGGPAATTLEVAIYQALRLDFDIARAVSLAFIQLIFCATLVATISQNSLSQILAPLRTGTQRFDGEPSISRLTDTLWIGIAIITVLPPLIAIVLAGATNINFSATLFRALATSMAIATTSAAIALPLVWLLSNTSAQAPPVRKLNDIVIMAAWILPPAVIATGWFIASRGWNGGIVQSALMVIALNVLMTLPLVSSVLKPTLERHARAHDRLCKQLNISGFSKFRLIDAPALKRPLIQAALMAFVLSLGDLTAVTLLGSQGLMTLPQLISQQMGNYRSAAAGGTALLLATLCYILTFVAQRFGKS
jgi:thiamine transport system permease protein